MFQTNCVVVRYSEIGLKGKNKSLFVNKLISNIKIFLAQKMVNFASIRPIGSRIIIYTDDKPILKTIFGISSYSYAVQKQYNLESLEKDVLVLANNTINKKDTFRVSVQRLDKTIKHTSIELERKLGEQIYTETKNSVSLKNPDVNLQIEILNKNSYLFLEKPKGFNGLPLGVDKSVSALIDSEACILSVLLMMRRGVFCSDMFIFGNLNTSLIDKYNWTDKKTNITKIKNVNDIKKYFVDILIVGDNTLNIKKYNLTSMILRPVIHLNEIQIKHKLEEF